MVPGTRCFLYLFFLASGWGVTALQGKTLHWAIGQQGWVVGWSLAPTCGLSEEQTLALPEMDQ